MKLQASWNIRMGIDNGGKQDQEKAARIRILDPQLSLKPRDEDEVERGRRTGDQIERHVCAVVARSGGQPASGGNKGYKHDVPIWLAWMQDAPFASEHLFRRGQNET